VPPLAALILFHPVPSLIIFSNFFIISIPFCGQLAVAVANKVLGRTNAARKRSREGR
jgi:hypothetical protein